MNDPAQRAGSAMPTLVPGTTVAVTGATGFIGGRLVEYLMQQGTRVTCLVPRTTVSARLRDTGAEQLVLSIADPEAVRAALAGIDIVVHCAYDTNNPEWNTRALTSLIEGCRANRCRRLVHISSFVVYHLPDDGEVTEDSASETSSEGYARIKRELEAMLLRAIRENGLPGTIIQPTIVYGPFSRPWTIDPAESLYYGTVILPDAGEGTCNAVYVDDVVSAIILAAESPSALGERYLVSGPAPVTWRHFFEETAQAIGAPGPQFWSTGTIARENGKARRILQLMGDPGNAMRHVARIRLCGKALRAALRVLPTNARRSVHEDVFGPLTRRRKHLHVPDPGRLNFLQCRTAISSDKARRELGYAPRFDLEAGMVATGPYLKKMLRAEGSLAN